MARGYGEPDVTYVCQVAGCGAKIFVPNGTRGEDVVCDECGCPMWPIELGFTGNAREHVMEFVMTHDFMGKPLPSKRYRLTTQILGWFFV